MQYYKNYTTTKTKFKLQNPEQRTQKNNNNALLKQEMRGKKKYKNTYNGGSVFCGPANIFSPQFLFYTFSPLSVLSCLAPPYMHIRGTKNFASQLLNPFLVDPPTHLKGFFSYYKRSIRTI